MSDLKDTLKKLFEKLDETHDENTCKQHDKDREVQQARMLYAIANDSESGYFLTVHWNAGSVRGAYLNAAAAALDSDKDFEKQLKQFKETCDNAYSSLKELKEQLKE